MTAVRRSRHPVLAAPWRVLASALAVLVFALGMGSVSPSAHAWMHGEQSPAHDACDHHAPAAPAADDDGHICAVVLFASGVELPLDTAFLCLALENSNAVILAPDALYLAKPRYLRQPERGPPAV